jgi:phage tail sheath protein FI
MPFQLSPGVNVTEIDLTGIVPAVASSDGAIAGVFNWGPVGTRQLIDTEAKLVSTFGKPNSNNYETWFSASNFLSYGNRLYVTRVANTVSITSGVGTLSAVANTGSVADLTAQVVRNNTDYDAKTFDTAVRYVARYPGALGNSLKISVCDSVNAFSSVLSMNAATTSLALGVAANLAISIGSSSANLQCTATSGTAADANTYATALVAGLTVGDILTVGNSSIGTQNLRIASIGAISYDSTGACTTITFDSTYRLATAFNTSGTINNSVKRHWEYSTVIDNSPIQSDYVSNFGNMNTAIDGMHVVVVDEHGKFTGIPGTVLESYSNVSRATDAKGVSGQTNYYKTVINQSSNYVWFANDRADAASALATQVASSTNYKPLTISMTGGQDGYTESTTTLALVAGGYDQYKSAEDVDVSLVLQGKPIGTGGSYELANYIIDNICETRKDCIVLISPDDSVVLTNAGNEALALVGWRNQVHDSSYAVLDSGYKYQYDRYNDVYRYVPCNGDIAGLCARTDSNRDPWWSPAGFNRGQIKNLVKLRWNPRQADRDILYKNGINPIVSFPGKGTILYGDKTLQSKPSAFDRINVRRLFIVLEKAIATASKFFLFEFNDEFTRAQFKNLVVPYLRDVQGRRGVTDFLVVCDATNNTAERIDRNEFWGDIYIKPARSINFIQLNFVAVSTGVQFSEIVGKF